MTIRRVGSISVLDSSSTSGASASVTRSVAAGSFIVITTRGSCALSTPAGFSVAKHQTNSDAPSYQTYIFYLVNATAGSTTFTVNRSGSSGAFSGTLVEYSGMGAATLGPTSGYGFYATSPAFPTTGTLPTAVCLAIASFYAGGSSGDPVSGPGGWTTEDTATSPYEYVVSSLVTASTAALTPNWTTPYNMENANSLAVFVPGPPPTAAVLSSPSIPAYTAYTATATVSSDTTGGLSYCVATQTNTAPSATQIEAGTDAANFACPHAQTSGASGTQTFSLTGLSANTTYYVWFVQDNGSVSNIPTVTFTTYPPPPSITSVDTESPRYHGSLTVNYENGGTTQGTITVGGVAQTITSWTSLQAVIGSVARGSNKYGVPLDVVVTSAIGSPSTPHTLTQLLPQTGYSFTNLGTPISPDTERVTTTPTDIASADQVAWESSVATMYPDGSASSPSPVSWQAEVWTPTYGWGSLGTLSITTSGGGSSSFVADFFGAVASTIGSCFGAAVSTLSRAF